MKIHNYSAGPCILPQEVLKKASEAVNEIDGIGLSLIEISHRSKTFVGIMEKARSLVKELLEVPDNYEVLFLQGGASLGFLEVAYNMTSDYKKSLYINTGTWSTKAIKEAQLLNEVEVIASSEDKNFSYIPKGFSIPENADYLHFTTNNTIFGTQFKKYPTTNVSLVADMSSDIFSKKINVKDFDIIYAGAQKNMGPAGTTLFIVNTDIFKRNRIKIPTMLDFQTHIKKGSMFNTPPVFAIYTSMLTLEWLKEHGGIDWIEKRNEAKAELLYNEIDRNPLFEGVANVEDRSLMNATFTLKNGDLEEKFNAMWNDAGISGLKGHRSVGGYRASMYNALPLESVKVLVEVMNELEKQA